ncbi:integral membrane protein [Diaporthe amygdali]|uniref:uncharacterized protein n=1 Tax=Phomopsis amygdali TaxID=1214568 RepID=UPI0022FE9BF9|nr:uncharacterized protein J7T55_009332 [Diaporthe amygdali]KAJ0107368.1 integral membrane protein [Diaporthe amygdali]
MLLHEVLSRAASETDTDRDHDVGVGTTIDTSDYAAAKRYAAAALLAVAIYNAIEMIPIIYFTFSRFSGLYFWSMVTAVTGVLINATGFVLNNFQLTGNDYDWRIWHHEIRYKHMLTRGRQQTLPTILTTTFWVPMVSGQSLVLYSRLYLVNLDKRIRRYVLAMIIVNGVVLHTATAVTAAGSNSKVSELFITPYAIIERIQITIFCVQEFILSGLYVWKAWGFLAVYRSGGSQTQDKLRAMMLHLILSNVVVVSLDITVIVLEFMGLYYLQALTGWSKPSTKLQLVAYKAFVYSVKLKCEVGILNKLVDFVKYTSAKRQQHSSDSFRMTSQIEREWEKTLRTTFGVTGTAFGDEDEDDDHKQQHNQQHQKELPGVPNRPREPLGAIDERRSSGSTRVDGASMDGGSGVRPEATALAGAPVGLRERPASLDGPGQPLWK